jgi:hypothetical protein
MKHEGKNHVCAPFFKKYMCHVFSAELRLFTKLEMYEHISNMSWKVLILCYICSNSLMVFEAKLTTIVVSCCFKANSRTSLKLNIFSYRHLKVKHTSCSEIYRQSIYSFT